MTFAKLRRWTTFAAGCCFVAGTAAADVVVLKDGQRIEGVATERGAEVEIELDFGTLSIARDEVAAIERSETPLQMIDDAWQRLLPGDVVGRYRLALKAEQLGLSRRAKALFWEVLALDPDHKGARRALGFARLEGRWVTEEELMIARGFVQYHGQWVTPQAALALEDAAEQKREKAQAQAQSARVEALEAEVSQARAEAHQAKVEAERARARTREHAIETWDLGPAGIPVFFWPPGQGQPAAAPMPPHLPSPPPAAKPPAAPAPKGATRGRR